jgi:TRAP-type C4-dicarboxylate transport system substrate-binding protein
MADSFARFARSATIVVAAALALAGAVTPRAAHAQAQVIKLATLVPEGSVWDKGLREMGAEWSTATQNRVTLRVYPGGVAGDEPDVVRKMRIGQLQAAAVTTAGLANIDHAFELFKIPMFFDSYPELDAVLDKMTPLLKQRLEAKGFVLLNWGHGGWLYFFSKNPVVTVDDLKKSKMFWLSGDDAMVQRWKAQGFQPVPLSAVDILSGLQTGMIDAYPTTPLIALSLQWYKSTPYMSSVGLDPLVGGLVMTKAAWNKLTPADRAAVSAACSKAEKRLKADVPRQDTTAVAEMRKRGLTVTKVPPQVVTGYRAMAQSFATSMRGAIVPEDILDMAIKERDAYRAAHK